MKCGLTGGAGNHSLYSVAFSCDLDLSFTTEQPGGIVL